jgi:hypothetical protein
MIDTVSHMGYGTDDLDVAARFFRAAFVADLRCGASRGGRSAGLVLSVALDFAPCWRRRRPSVWCCSWPAR